MNDKRCIISFEQPATYKMISNYADSSRDSFGAIRKLRPKDQQAIKGALDEFLNNSLFQNCKPNDGYIEALGLGAKIDGR
jgi:hypothetical protein